MKKIILTGIIGVASFLSFGQTTTIADNDTICDCTNASSVFNGGTPNFTDAQGTADYAPNSNDTITFCPDAGASKISVEFKIVNGYEWDINSSDTLYIYDGPNTSSPLIGAYNTSTNPTGVVVQASWNNPSGCLTFVFISDGSNEGAGWKASITCVTPPQPYTVHMEGYVNGQANGAGDNVNDITPADTGFIDLCLGDSVMFVALPNFPNDPTNTGVGGYDQINTHTVFWETSRGDTSSNDTLWFKPNDQAGYTIKLIVKDTFPQSKFIEAIVRVSTTPSFSTCHALKDTICEGQLTNLSAEASNQGGGTASGAQPTTGFVNLGGVFSTVTYLPDGSGQNYTTDINITGFPTGLTIQNPTDIQKICLSMEHSYLGDLEMKLTCPNGQSVNIFNAFTGNGLFPGGFGGSNTYIGGAYDGNTGSVGVCEEYCFSELPAASPSWAALAAGSGIPTVPASGPSTGSMITPGMYNPEESFLPALQNCPLNGTWTITVRDNQPIDDGFICEWGIFFEASLDPNSISYTPTIVNEFWSPDPTIVTVIDSLNITVAPPLGTTGYVFNVTDNFGCHYDTTINVTVIPGPSISAPTSGCMGSAVQFTNTYAPDGGQWSYSGPGNLTFSPNTTFINPAVSVDVPGTYTLYFNDVQCGDTVSQQITFEPLPAIYIPLSSDTICRGDSLLITAQSSDPNNVIWNTNPPQLGETAIFYTDSTYTATVTNQCGSASDEFELFIIDCKVPNVITPNGDGVNDYYYTNIAENYGDTHFTVFNRWGRKVYEKESYDNSWNGKNKGGKDLADGTYYYILTYSGGKKVEKGFITIMRNP